MVIILDVLFKISDNGRMSLNILSRNAIVQAYESSWDKKVRSSFEFPYLVGNTAFLPRCGEGNGYFVFEPHLVASRMRATIFESEFIGIIDEEFRSAPRFIMSFSQVELKVKACDGYTQYTWVGKGKPSGRAVVAAVRGFAWKI